VCGIFGWLTRRPLDDGARAVAGRMQDALAHRGPDDRGLAAFPHAMVGMTRLAVVDLDTGHQPMTSPDGRHTIVFNGEVYNFTALRAELERDGAVFLTRSDTEVVLAAYRRWGEACVSRFVGMFAFAIHDRDGGRETLFVARDRLGKKPLYYVERPGFFAFASEIKALLEHPEVSRRMRRQAVPLLLTYGYVPPPETIFADVLELPPASTLRTADGGATIRRYWELPTPAAANLDDREAEERFTALLKQAVADRLVADVPLGAFLSGGLDSSAVVACMVEASPRRVRTFAIGFAGEPSFDELAHARRVATHLGTEHTEFVVRPNAVELLPTLVWHYDQPFADSSALPTFLVARETRREVTVALTGDGGDELLAGYDRFVAARLARAWRLLPSPVRRAVQVLLDGLAEGTSYHGRARRARRFVASAALAPAERYLGWVSVFPPLLLAELLRDEVEGDVSTHVLAAFARHRGGDELSRELAVNATTYLPGDLLVKTDRMTMACSLEARCPLLDHRLVELAATLPSRLKISGLTTKVLLRRAMAAVLPAATLRRRKQGFGAPVGTWFRGALGEALDEMLLAADADALGLFRAATVRRLVEEHRSGARDHGQRLWALLTLTTWARVFRPT